MIARGTGFVKGHPLAAQSRLVAHLKYIEHRSKTENESRDDRRLFTKDEDRVTRSAAVQDVMDHAHTQVAYHKIVLSPGEDEHVADWHEWTRGVMDDLEKKQGRELHWYAVYHNNTDNPHVHVVLAGSGNNLETGNREAVKMYQKDYELLRQSGTDRSDRDWYRQIEEQARQEDRRDQEEITRSREEVVEPHQAHQGGDHDR
jgi:type IV secretory pathway VirD2 relaxase